MSELLRGRKSEEITQLHTFSTVFFDSQKGRWQLKFIRMKKFLEEERMEREKELVLLSVEEEQIGAQTLRKVSEEELSREMLTPA